jgi:hypothetical protein
LRHFAKKGLFGRRLEKTGKAILGIAGRERERERESGRILRLVLLLPQPAETAPPF